METNTADVAPPASVIVIDPSGHRARVELTPLPFKIGRQADNHLILRDSRASREHARIVSEDGEYKYKTAAAAMASMSTASASKARRCTIPIASNLAFRIPTSSSSPWKAPN